LRHTPPNLGGNLRGCDEDTQREAQCVHLPAEWGEHADYQILQSGAGYQFSKGLKPLERPREELLWPVDMRSFQVGPKPVADRDKGK
jgi:hypothetical protein